MGERGERGQTAKTQYFPPPMGQVSLNQWGSDPIPQFPTQVAPTLLLL